MSCEPEKSGCLSQIAGPIAAVVLLTLIQTFFGRAASMWFGGGFICAALMAFWEAGSARRARGEAS